MGYVIPTTREEAIEILGKRQRRKQAKTKYDMLLGGLVCCSDEEFYHITCVIDRLALIPCVDCASQNNCNCVNFSTTSCGEMQEETLSKKWNANLYN